jgi:hypothetical protein
MMFSEQDGKNLRFQGTSVLLHQPLFWLAAGAAGAAPLGGAKESARESSLLQRLPK